jgi:gamma-glutamyltranspeptidase/glutathione hydrolase
MLDDGYLASRARLIDPTRAQSYGPGHQPQGGTIYLTAADASGMMVSFIQSNYMGFGSGVVVPGYGLSLQNRGHGFNLNPASDNCVGPGKRPFHTIIPAFLTKGGKPVMSYGVMGGDMQPQGHLQTLVRMLDYHQHPQAACDAPRWRYFGGVLNAEQGFDAATAQGLRELGHRVEPFADSYQDYGAGQFIWRLDEGQGDVAALGYAAASDPRRDGQAAGY